MLEIFLFLQLQSSKVVRVDISLKIRILRLVSVRNSNTEYLTPKLLNLKTQPPTPKKSPLKKTHPKDNSTSKKSSLKNSTPENLTQNNLSLGQFNPKNSSQRQTQPQVTHSLDNSTPNLAK